MRIKNVRRRGLSVLAALVFAAPVSGLAQQERGHLDPVAPQETETARRAGRVSKYVSVNVNASLAEYGAVYLPAVAEANAEFVGQRNARAVGAPAPDVEASAQELAEQYFYPCIDLNISLSPYLVPVRGNPRFEERGPATDSGDEATLDPAVVEVLNTDQDAKWLDVAVELQAYARTGGLLRRLPTESLQIIRVFPERTDADTKELAAVTAASSISAASGQIVPTFVPAIGQAAQAVSNATNILFKKIFPDKAFTRRHTYIESSNRFGWYFQQDKESDSAKSLLGLHRGKIFLRATTDVQFIGVHFSALSEWTKKANAASGRYDWTERDCALIAVSNPRLVELESTDYRTLDDLRQLPLLVPKAMVMRILHVDAKQYAELCAGAAPALRTSKNPDYVIRASLEEFVLPKALR